MKTKTGRWAFGMGMTALACALAGVGVLDDPPPIIDAGRAGCGQEPGAAPSDAVVLFDGTSLDAFSKMDGSEAGWRIEDGVLVIQPGAGSIISKRQFGDAQFHVEFATPVEAAGESQGRGNSGVYVQGRYEVQVLDSFKSSTYPTGQCGAIYGQHIPLVNACRGPGQWQSFDIVFQAPRFDDEGKRVAEARMTVLHNGVVIHVDAAVDGPTGSAPFAEAPGDGPLYLQDHGNPVRYRNIWVRPL